MSCRIPSKDFVLKDLKKSILMDIVDSLYKRMSFSIGIDNDDFYATKSIVDLNRKEFEKCGWSVVYELKYSTDKSISKIIIS